MVICQKNSFYNFAIFHKLNKFFIISRANTQNNIKVAISSKFGFVILDSATPSFATSSFIIPNLKPALTLAIIYIEVDI